MATGRNRAWNGKKQLCVLKLFIMSSLLIQNLVFKNPRQSVCDGMSMVRGHFQVTGQSDSKREIRGQSFIDIKVNDAQLH